MNEGIVTLEEGRYLLLLLLLAPYLGLSIRWFRHQSGWLRRFSGGALSRSAHLRTVGLTGLSFAAAVVSLAGPTALYQEAQPRRSGILIAIGIDISKSMLAEDAIRPEATETPFEIANRFNRARRIALDVIDRLNGEWVGLFIFARDGIEIVPLTQDYGYCDYVLRHIQDTDIAASGSDLSAAVLTGRRMLAAHRAPGVNVILLLSDGETTQADPEPLEDALNQARQDGIRVHAIGIGTPTPTLIPLRTAAEAGITDYYRDTEGAFLRTRMVEWTLRTLARETGGGYFSGAIPQAAEKWLEAVSRHADDTRHSLMVKTAELDLAPAFMLASVILFALGILFGR